MVSQILIYPPLLSPFIFPLYQYQHILRGKAFIKFYIYLFNPSSNYKRTYQQVAFIFKLQQVTTISNKILGAGSRILLYRILHYLRTQYSFPKGFTLPSIRIRLSNKRVIFHKNLIIQLNSCRFPSLLFSLQYGQSKPFIQESFKFNFFKKCHRYTFCFQHLKVC
ncbi:unnamed protein product [Paramecium octaurelia]|uniref:Uncharacterized protein n=1 Tax=Paramecium octaurelia TaxID=43137 RepID=A0A8S1YP72_PAROT|nr:unnamed protein product [Paramecium octaurelia]